MNIIVCVDDAGGMLFNGRRQSKDRILRAQARLLAEEKPLWMNSYSAKQFAEDGVPMVVDEAFLEHAPENAWCFVENVDVIPFADKIQKLAVYHWNRQYPSDIKFPLAVFVSRWKCVSTREFSGSSHDKITEEVYCP